MYICDIIFMLVGLSGIFLLTIGIIGIVPKWRDSFNQMLDEKIECHERHLHEAEVKKREEEIIQRLVRDDRLFNEVERRKNLKSTCKDYQREN